jgi:hypothetical protein
MRPTMNPKPAYVMRDCAGNAAVDGAALLQ